MEPPTIPFAPRSRLVRDYTAGDDANEPSYPGGGDFDHKIELLSPTRHNFSIPQRSHSLDKRPDDFTYATARVNGVLSPQSPTGDPTPWSSEHSEPQRSPTYQYQLDPLRRADPTLDSIEEQSTERSSYAPSVSSSHVSSHTMISGSLGSKMPDFFSNEVFQTVLHNPTTAHQLKLFSESRLCGENMEFLENVEKHRMLLNDVAKLMFEIHREFVSPKASTQINISDQMLVKVNKDLKTSLSSTLPKLESVFVDAQNEIENLVSFDIYPRFVRHQMTKSAAKALSGDRGKYAGLGDCFVLTDPAIADMPIVYASDGFVKVTGYSRSEIIPRNCRFLQCRQTDRSSVKRLRNAIDKRQESVEILLNETKDGKPFWNLLYTTPLFDAHGNVVFFLGGQINCSTTIHSSSDILRILAIADDVLENKETVAPATESAAREPSRSKGIFSAFRSNNKPANAQPRTAGMENGLLGKIEKMDLRTQMNTFHTAYSKFIVVNYSTFFIAFHSAGIIDLLYPARSPRQSQVVGTDIFKFFANHSNGSLDRDFKSRAKSSLRMGHAISLDLTLCTRRFMGFERFAVHFTPLKNEKGEVHWVVVTLGGESGR